MLYIPPNESDNYDIPEDINADKLFDVITDDSSENFENEIVVTAVSNDEKEDDFFTEYEVDPDDPSSALYHIFSDNFDKKTLKEPFTNFLLKGIKSGKKTIYNKTIRETRVFETEYIRQIENAYPYIVKIMRDPKKTIRYDEEVVQVEKARKTNSATIRHLSSHTQLIKKIEKNGDIIPAKVLTTFAEEEIAIYENRFIKSLINRVDKFVEKRHAIVKENLDSFQSDRIKITDAFKLDKKDIEITLDVSVKRDMEETMKVAKETFERLEKVRDQYRGLKSTEFMRSLAKARPVLPPIMKTNIILHNPDFRIAYALWLYLDRYDGLGFDLNVRERSHAYTDELSSDVDNIMAVSFATVLQHRKIGQVAFRKTTMRETIKKRIKEERNIGDEISLRPGNYELEKNALNEFYLQETAKYFKNSLKQQQKEGSGDTQSLRVVYKQMLEIVDNIYPTVFDARESEIEDNASIISLQDKLEIAKRRQQVLRIVREQKELNLVRMEKMEEKAKKEILQFENKLHLADQRARLREQKERERAEKLLAAQRAREEAIKAKAAAKEKEIAELQKAKEKALQDKAKAKEKEEARKARQKERNKAVAAERREHMKTSKRRNIRPRKRKTI